MSQPKLKLYANPERNPRTELSSPTFSTSGSSISSPFTPREADSYNRSKPDARTRSKTVDDETPRPRMSSAVAQSSSCIDILIIAIRLVDRLVLSRSRKTSKNKNDSSSSEPINRPSQDSFNRSLRKIFPNDDSATSEGATPGRTVRVQDSSIPFRSEFYAKKSISKKPMPKLYNVSTRTDLSTSKLNSAGKDEELSSQSRHPKIDDVSSVSFSMFKPSRTVKDESSSKFSPSSSHVSLVLL